MTSFVKRQTFKYLYGGRVSWWLMPLVLLSIGWRLLRLSEVERRKLKVKGD